VNIVKLILMLALFSCSSYENGTDPPPTNPSQNTPPTNLPSTQTSNNKTALWNVLGTNFPTMRGEYDMANDSSNDKIIAFGGRTGFRSDFQNVDETWSFDYSTLLWTNLEPDNSPPWRTSHTMVYDPPRNRILLFGGNDFERAYNDLWEYDYQLNSWQELSPNYPPEARQMHGMTYVQDRDIFILFGGRRVDGGAAFNDLWTYDSSTNTWKELNPSNPPPVQDHVNIAYYDAENILILFTGVETNRTPVTWAYDFETNGWLNLNSANTPDADHSNLVYDEFNEKLILFGSSQTDAGMRTWKFDYSANEWSDLTPQSMPDTHIEHDAMVYLSQYNVFIQYGGCCTDNTMELIITR